MPFLNVPIRLHPQINHRFNPGDVLMLSMVSESTYPRILVFQPNRRQQTRMRDRNNYIKFIGQMDYAIWEFIYFELRGRPEYQRVGHGMLRQVRVTVAPALTRVSPEIRQYLPFNLARYRQQASRVAPRPHESNARSMLIVRVEWN